MRSHGRFLLRSAPALTALVLACGCSLPGTFGVSSESTPKPSPHGPPPAPRPAGPTIGPGPAPILPLNLVPPETPQDQISLLSQKLAGADDDRKLIAARLAQLEATLQDKERALGEAADDIAKTGEEIGRARADVRRVKQEKDDLRDRLKKTEKELIDVQKENIKLKEREQEPAVPPAEPEPGKAP